MNIPVEKNILLDDCEAVVQYCDHTSNPFISCEIRPSALTPGQKIADSILPEIKASKILILNLRWSNAYGHIYNQVFAELLSIDEFYSEYDCILIPESQLIKNVLDCFGLKLSERIKFLSNNASRWIIRQGVMFFLNYNARIHASRSKIKKLKAAFHSAKKPQEKERKYLLYCSRADRRAARHGRSLLQENEDEIINCLKANSIKRGLDFHLLTGLNEDGSVVEISEQYELFWNSQLVVGPHGGAFSNLLFLNPSISPEVIEFSPGDRVTFNQMFRGLIGSFAEYNTILYGEDRTVSVENLKRILRSDL